MFETARYCGGAAVAGALGGGVVAAGAGITCPAFSCACSALSFATFDFADASAAFTFALAAASTRFCCLRCSFKSPLLIVPSGAAIAVVGAAGSPGVATVGVAGAGVTVVVVVGATVGAVGSTGAPAVVPAAGTVVVVVVVCPIAPAANTAPRASKASRVELTQNFIIATLTSGELNPTFPIGCRPAGNEYPPHTFHRHASSKVGIAIEFALRAEGPRYLSLGRTGTPSGRFYPLGFGQPQDADPVETCGP